MELRFEEQEERDVLDSRLRYQEERQDIVEALGERYCWWDGMLAYSLQTTRSGTLLGLTIYDYRSGVESRMSQVQHHDTNHRKQQSGEHCSGLRYQIPTCGGVSDPTRKTANELWCIGLCEVELEDQTGHYHSCGCESCNFGRAEVEESASCEAHAAVRVGDHDQDPEDNVVLRKERVRYVGCSSMLLPCLVPTGGETV